MSEHVGRGLGALIIKSALTLVVVLASNQAVPCQPQRVKSGQLVELSNVRLLRQSKKHRVLRLDIRNAGGTSVLFHPMREDQVIEYATVRLPEGVTIRDIDQGLRSKKLSLDPRETKRKIVLKLPRHAVFDQGQISANAHGCADLVIDTVWLVRQTRKEATIQFVIANRGVAPAPISQLGTVQKHNVSVKVLFNSLPKASRGAIDQAGFFIQLPKRHAGVLLPGETVTVEQKIDISDNTRMTPFIILQLDALLEIAECADSNNEKAVFLRF